MSDIYLKTIDDVFNIIDEYEKINYTKFRGQSNFEWGLIPKVGRAPYNNMPEEFLFRQWKRRAHSYLSNPNYNKTEWLTIAQHYGLATRLLDWSHNPLVALFFAVNDFSDIDGAFFVYVSNKFYSEIVDPFKLKVDEDVILYSPITTSNRIANQFGYFTIHKYPEKDMLSSNHSGKLLRYIIPKEIKQSIIFKLHHYGVNNLSIYPDLEGLAKHLNWFSENYGHWTSSKELEF